MNLEHPLLSLLDRFGDEPILVVGDVMLDRYWWGSVNRISPEAPVPVVRKARTSMMPGGAANAAANLAALGARVTLVGLVGDDEAGRDLRAALAPIGIDASRLVVAPGRPTTVKTRIVAHQQHVVRVDEEDSSPIPADAVVRALEQVERAAEAARAILVSDYAKGFLVAGLLRPVIERARARGVPVLVDPKGTDYARYAGATIITPNRSELAVATGMPVNDRSETIAAATRLLDLLDGTHVLATEGEHGMTLVRRGLQPVPLPTHAKRVYDVTGAGDTVIATLTMALAAGGDPVESAALANRAAGLAVEQLGAVAVSREDVRKALQADAQADAAAAQAP